MNAWMRFVNGSMAVSLWLGLLTGCQTTQDKPLNNAWNQNKSGKLDAAGGKLPELKNLNIPEEGERRIEPETYLAAARLHESLGNNPEAIEQYRKAITLKANYTDALSGLANLYTRLGRFQDAEDTYRQAIESASDKAYLWNNRAFCYLMQQRWSEAEADLCYALELCPDFGRARINYAMVMAQQDRFDEALAQFKMVLSEADAYYNIGLMYQSRRRPAEAAEAYRQALARNPQLVAAQKRLEKLPEVAAAYPADSQILGSPQPSQKVTENEQATTRPASMVVERHNDADPLITPPTTFSSSHPSANVDRQAMFVMPDNLFPMGPMGFISLEE